MPSGELLFHDKQPLFFNGCQCPSLELPFRFIQKTLCIIEREDEQFLKEVHVQAPRFEIRLAQGEYIANGFMGFSVPDIGAVDTYGDIGIPFLTEQDILYGFNLFVQHAEQLSVGHIIASDGMVGE